MLVSSTTWDRERLWLRPKNLGVPLARESLARQNLSRFASDAEADAYPIPFRRSSTRNGKTRTIKPRAGKAPPEPNRILELHGLMGAIGERAGLARTFELDVQRLVPQSDCGTRSSSAWFSVRWRSRLPTPPSVPCTT